ncbi:MAG: hypothetical protein COW30_12700 [Rhodospirillales bacterium CG15_BIG_FIL_POST_REV_8_21_14_020_66_15]|nr:MAG: hypothetical protein COW30_12700 [Rhodospirillales bacterium CG15_BIG_FIL_POST_REV_8_21_14_020_66_15]
MNKLIPVLAGVAMVLATMVYPAVAQQQTDPMRGKGASPPMAEEGGTGGTPGGDTAIPGGGKSMPHGSATPAPQTGGDAKPDDYVSAKELRGKDVFDKQGDKVATVKDVVAKPGKPPEVLVMTVGSFLGFGGKDVRVPVNEVFVGEKGELVVAMSEEELEKFPPELPR